MLWKMNPRTNPGSGRQRATSKRVEQEIAVGLTDKMFLKVAIMLVLGLPTSGFAQNAEGIEIFDTVVRRTVTPAESGERAAGPVASFDVAAFRGDIADRGPAVTPHADPVDDKPIVLPREYIDWQAGERDAGSLIIDDYYFDSEIDQGASYGYQTTDYAIDNTCRTVTTVLPTEEGAVRHIANGRSPLTRTRTGYAGTINARNLSCFVEIECGDSSQPTGKKSSNAQTERRDDEAAPLCLSNGAAEELYASILECNNDGLCYKIQETGQ